MINKEDFMVKLQEAIRHIDEALLKPDNEITDYDIPKEALVEVKKEISIMQRTLDKRIYIPTYPRFILDYPKSALRSMLMHVAYLYEEKLKI